MPRRVVAAAALLLPPAAAAAAAAEGCVEAGRACGGPRRPCCGDLECRAGAGGGRAECRAAPPRCCFHCGAHCRGEQCARDGVCGRGRRHCAECGGEWRRGAAVRAGAGGCCGFGCFVAGDCSSCPSCVPMSTETCTNSAGLWCPDPTPAPPATPVPPATPAPPAVPPTPSPPSAGGYYPPAGGAWEARAPGDAGFDEATLALNVAKLASNPASNGGLADCVVVLKGGYIVAEEYHSGRTADTLSRWYSVTKAVAALLVGVAERDGVLRASDRASEYLHSWAGGPSAEVTVENLLAQDSGREFDFYSDFLEIDGQPDVGAWCEAKGQQSTPACGGVCRPGQHWLYSNCAYQNVASVLRAALGVDGAGLRAWAAEKVFDVVGMQVEWGTDAAGNPDFYGGMRGTCRDAARLGLLSARGNEWAGAPLTTADFFSRSVTPRPTNDAYGYGVWLNRVTAVGSCAIDMYNTRDCFPSPIKGGCPEHIWNPSGLFGQEVVVDAEHDLVVARLNARDVDVLRPSSSAYKAAACALRALPAGTACDNGWAPAPPGPAPAPTPAPGGAECPGRDCAPGQACWPTAADIAAFRASFGGTLLAAGDAAYAAQVLMMNTRYGNAPALVAVCRAAADVAAAVRFATAHDIRVTILSGAHSYIGRSADPAGNALMVSLREMKHRSVAGDHAAITFGPGNWNKELYEEVDRVAPEKLFVGGSGDTVAAGGYLVGGGHSPNSPQHGLGADSVVAVEVVDWRGDVLDVTAAGARRAGGGAWVTRDGSLFWALRGGGGASFGIVTSFTARLHDAPPAFTRVFMSYPMGGGQAEALVDFLGTEWLPATEADRKWSGYFLPSYTGYRAVLAASGAPAAARDMWGPPRNVTAEAARRPRDAGVIELGFFYHGTESEARAAGRALIDFHPDWRSAFTVQEYARFWDYQQHVVDPTGFRGYVAGTHLQPESWTPAFARTLVDFIQHQPQVSPGFDQTRLLCVGTRVGGAAGGDGGRQRRRAPAAVSTAFRRANMVLTCIAGWGLESTDGVVVPYMRDTFTPRLQGHGEGTYFNEMGPDQVDWKERVWGRDLYDALVVAKRAHDPCNLWTCEKCVASDEEVPTPPPPPLTPAPPPTPAPPTPAPTPAPPTPAPTLKCVEEGKTCGDDPPGPDPSKPCCDGLTCYIDPKNGSKMKCYTRPPTTR